jgi:hypothetical protein
MRKSKRTSAEYVKTALVLCLAGWLCAACHLQPSRKEIMISREQAIATAQTELTKHGFAAADYDVTVDADGKTGWMVWFEKKGPFPVPGGRHAVRVDASTGRAVFMPGE